MRLHRRPARILETVDGSAEAQQALAVARELARRAGATLHVVTVVEPLAFGAVPVSAMEPAASAGRLLEEEMRAVHNAAVGESRELVETQSVVASGEPADVLLEQSRQLDVLVAGSRGYGPLGAVLLGSTTRELMHGAGCPVIIVPRGRGFGLVDARAALRCTVRRPLIYEA